MERVYSVSVSPPIKVWFVLLNGEHLCQRAIGKAGNPVQHGAGQSAEFRIPAQSHLISGMKRGVPLIFTR